MDCGTVICGRAEVRDNDGGFGGIKAKGAGFEHTPAANAGDVTFRFRDALELDFSLGSGRRSPEEGTEYGSGEGCDKGEKGDGDSIRTRGNVGSRRVWRGIFDCGRGGT